MIQRTRESARLSYRAVTVHSFAPAPLVLRNRDGLSFGSFRGGLPALELGTSARGRIADFLGHKRWTYCALASDELFVGCAVVSLGYASTALLFVADPTAKSFLFDESFVGGPFAIRFADGGSGCRNATFTGKGVSLSVGDRGMALKVERTKRRGELSLQVSATPGRQAPAMGAVVPVAGGFANATEKRYCPVRGRASLGQRSFTFDKALMGTDHTRGVLARATAWRWAFLMGRTTSGATVVVNLVEGFVGEAECCVWIDGELHALGEGRFSYDATRPLSEWRISTTCGSVELRFSPFALHRETKELLFVRSNFMQPVGAFSGTVRVPTPQQRERQTTFFLENVAGVTEHQDVLW